MPSLAYTQMNQTKNTVLHQCLHWHAFNGHFYTSLHVNNLAVQFQSIQLKEMKMAYHSDEIRLDIDFSLTGLLLMHVVYSNFDK